jgi:uncharacterized protein
MEKVLVTGGTGMIGRHLTNLLQEKGYEVVHLSRSAKGLPDIKTYQWDVENQILQEGALDKVTYIIHLAGAGIADKRWTEARKQVIRNSRVKSAQLLFRELKKIPHQVKAFITASGIDIYGKDRGDQLLTEESSFGEGFLPQVCKDWEGAADSFAELGIRVVKMRTGIVLSEKGGALEKITQPIRLGAGAPLGSGKQWMSWIHIKDLCKLYVFAVENENIHGSYNAVGKNAVTNKEMTKQIAHILNKPLILPNVPAFVLKIALGELASLVLGSKKVSSEKIRKEGFALEFENLPVALEDLLK